jgi:hypothetical protein
MRQQGLVWSPKDHTPEKKRTCEEKLETVLQNMDNVLAAANRMGIERDRLVTRCHQLESWLLSGGIEAIEGNFILKEVPALFAKQ